MKIPISGHLIALYNLALLALGSWDAVHSRLVVGVLKKLSEPYARLAETKD